MQPSRFLLSSRMALTLRYLLQRQGDSLIALAAVRQNGLARDVSMCGDNSMLVCAAVYSGLPALRSASNRLRLHVDFIMELMSYRPVEGTLMTFALEPPKNDTRVRRHREPHINALASLAV